MTKFWCDVCKNEIIEQEEIADFAYLESLITIDGKRNFVAKKSILCGDCKTAVQKYLEEVAKKAVDKKKK